MPQSVAAASTPHTKLQPPLVPGGRRLTAEDLDVERDSRALWREITVDETLMRRVASGPVRWIIYRLRRTDHRSDPLEVLARVLIGFFNAGFPEAMLRRIPLYLDRIIDDCFVGNAFRSIDTLDLEEHALESSENGLALSRRIDGAAPEALEKEAELNEAEACVQIERARLLRRQARAIRREQGGT